MWFSAMMMYLLYVRCFVIIIVDGMLVSGVFFGFFFKQKTAYEMRSSDWSSDVCSSDLVLALEITTADGKTEMHHVDEGIRFDANLEAIKNVKLLVEGGAITAATSSQICDGASGVMIVNEKGLKQLGR